MPVLRDIPVELQMGNVVRAQGIADMSRLREPIRKALYELIAMVREDGVLHTAAAYETYPVAAITDSHLKVEGSSAVLHGTFFDRVMADAREVVALVCTIGPQLETRSAECFEQGESLRGLLLDGIGSAAVGALGSRACQTVAEEARTRGYRAGSPVSPGSPRFSVAEQHELFKMVPADEIGVTLSGSGLMVPRKSISMVIGIGDRMPTWTHAESCDRCTMGPTCTYRVRA